MTASIDTYHLRSVSIRQSISATAPLTITTGLNYLVQIDSDGKLRWAKTGELVDTTAGHWKDAGDGRGIIPLTNPSRTALEHRTSFEATATRSSSSIASEEHDAQMHYYLGPVPAGSRFKAWLWRNLTPRGLMERLLRKTLQRNTWIYVSVSIEHNDSLLCTHLLHVGQALCVLLHISCPI